MATIQPSLAKSLPSLRTLVLTQNNLAELADLDPLQGFEKLTHVSLVENPVASKEVCFYLVAFPNIAKQPSPVLPLLPPLAVPTNPLPRLPKGARSRTR